MHRNTFIFIIFLAVISAIIAGINISNRLHPAPEPTPAPSVPTTATPTPTVALQVSDPNERKQILVYDNAYCGVSLKFDTAIMQFREEASDSATFLSMTDPKDMIVLGCQQDIPRPALSLASQETKTIGTIQTTLYHDTSSKDGEKTDVIIFTHPKNKMDIYIAGYGKNFNDLIATLTVK